MMGDYTYILYTSILLKSLPISAYSVVWGYRVRAVDSRRHSQYFVTWLGFA